MGFEEVRFPTNLSYGTRSAPGFASSLTEVESGADEALSRRSTPRYTYDAKYAIKSYDNLATVVAFFNARKGIATGFRFKDWLDYTSNANGRSAPTNMDVEIGVGDGTSSTFQLVKKYTSGSQTTIRTIKKPVAGSVLIALNGVNQTTGWSVNTTNGVVTFDVAPTLGVSITAGYEHDIPVRFAKEIDSGLPQTIETFDSGAIDSIPIVEILDERAVSDEPYMGGGADLGVLTADISVTPISGRVLVFAANTAGRKIFLPDTTNYIPGAPYFYFVNEGSNSCAICDSGGSTLATLTAGSSIEFVLATFAGSVKAWLPV